MLLGEALKIRPKICSNALGEEGTCMFVWECIKTEGKHLGTCVDGFLFGSCCGHNETHNSIDLNPNIYQTSSISSSSYEKPSTTSLVTSTVQPLSSTKPTKPTKPTQVFTTTTTKPKVTTKKPSIPVTTINSTEYNNNVHLSQSNVAQQPSQEQLTPSSIAKPWPTAPSPIHCKLKMLNKTID